jgi:AcrR family transcriptional regulator
VVKAAAAKADWREQRRRFARGSILEAAWSLVDESGLAAITMRDLADRAGITVPTVYAYFDSKNAVFDEMFAQSAQQFAAEMSAPYRTDDSLEFLSTMARRFVDFCLSDVGRYQLLFQRTIPGFEPSAQSYAHAVTALEHSRRQLATVGVSTEVQVDLLTALLTGLVDQQISNDPGGDRWTRLIDDAIDMFFTHCQRSGQRSRTDSRSRSRQARRTQ